MAVPSSLFWVTWSSLSGAETSTLHPASVDMLKIGVREKLKRQVYDAAAALPAGVPIRDIDTPTIIAFQHNMLFPRYEYDDLFARDAQGKATDRLVACTISPIAQPETATAQACNELIERVLTASEQFDASELVADTTRQNIGQPPPRLQLAYRYDATAEEHVLLKAQPHQPVQEHRIYLTSRGVEIMRKARHLFTKDGIIGYIPNP